MRKFFQKYDILTRFLSLFLSVCLWVSVMKVQNPDKTKSYGDIPLKLIGADALLADQGLVVIDGQDQKVALQIEGMTSDIGNLDKSKISVEVDLSEIRETGEHTLPYAVTLPKTLSSLRIKKESPDAVTLTLDKMSEKSVPVSVSLSASAPAEYQYETPTPEVNEITVKGPQTVLDQIETARIVMQSDDLTQTTTMPYRFTLEDANGAEVTSPYLSADLETITVSLGVNKIATLPLEVDLIPSEDVTKDMASVTITPSTIQVYGAPAVINKLQAIKLDTIDLATTQTGTERTVRIQPPEGVKLVDGQPKTATIVLQIDGMASRTLSISDIQLVDTNTADTKPEVTTNDAYVQVTLRGSNSFLTMVNATDVKVTATFDSAALGVGVHEVPVTVAIPSYESSVSVLEYTETIKIEILEATEPEPITPTEPEVTE